MSNYTSSNGTKMSLPSSSSVPACFEPSQNPGTQAVVYNPCAQSLENAAITTATKRNNEDSQRYYSGSVNNGAKKMKTESYAPHQVSKVVHLRSLPSDVSDSEVIQLGMTFGKVTNVLMLKGKNQAFLQMEDEETATNMVNNSENQGLTIRQRVIYIQFSNHKELKTDSSPNQRRAQAVLQALQQTEGGPNHVLRAVVENMLYPISIDVLRTIFCKYGVVLKIITFNKGSQFQALIQMGDSFQSQTAKMELDGKNIYNGCCTLRIEFSRLNLLNVKFNNDKSRDFTRCDLPSGVETTASPLLPSTNPYQLLGNNLDTRGLIQTPQYSALATIFQQQQQSQHLASLAASSASGSSLARGISGSLNQLNQHSISALSNQIPSLNQSNMPFNQLNQQRCVLHVSNLNEEMVTSPDTLFMLFGVYGDVIRVKILFQKKSSALVQMHDGNQADLVRRFLNNIRFFGRQLNIVLSKHAQVQLPKEGLDAENLTQDYNHSPLHRFKKPGSKNFQNIFPPSEVLHLSNIPIEITEEFITDLFAKHGTVHGFKFFAKDRKMALIKLTDVDEAMRCLVSLHNYKLSDNNHLRVSFSKGHI